MNTFEPVIQKDSMTSRYLRHLSLPEIGVSGQRKLLASSVLLIGAGGLGSPAGLYLAAAGVGRIGIADDDVVELSNLQRQILHATGAVGNSKVQSAARRLTELNPDVRVETHAKRVDASNVCSLMSGYDVVIDGSDSLATRYVVNEACVRLTKPYVYGSVSRFEGQVSVFHTGDSGCYACLYPPSTLPAGVPNCAENGVLGVVPGVVGTLQATEALKIILGVGDVLANRLLLFNALTMKFRELHFARDPDCPVCGNHPAPARPVEKSPNEEMPMIEITPIDLKRRLDAGDRMMVVDVREPHELAICRLAGSHSIPLAQVVQRMSELDAGRDTIVMCRSGGRSAKAIADLQQAGYAGTLINLKGGILAWADDVDPAITRY